MLVTPKVVLKINGKYYMPGIDADLPDNVVSELLGVGLVTATVEPAENAMMPKPKNSPKNKRSVK